MTMHDADVPTPSFPTQRTIALLYASLCLFRITNSLLIQTQFDPDEYWQTLEPAYCEAFQKHNCAYTWEWTRRATDGADWWMQAFKGPIRSYLSVFPTYLFYTVAKRLQWDELYSWIVPRGPLLLHAVLVAAPTDLATWYMGQWVGSSSYNGGLTDGQSRRTFAYCCLFCSVTSWFNGYALIRTYSNSVECMLVAVSIALVSPELFGGTSLLRYNLRMAVAFVLGGMSVAVRFTSLVAYISVGVLLALQKSALTQKAKFLFIPCAIFGLVGLGISFLVDKYFFGFWTVPFLGSLHFNVILGLGSLYGTHAFHWYLSAGIPAITGTLLPFILYDVWKLCTHSPSLSQRNAWVIILSYTILHSFSAHKEFRFLLPMLPLFCVRAGHVICNKMFSTRRRRLILLLLFVVPNLVAVLFLGTFHQGAPIQINRYIRHLLQTRLSSNKAIHIHYLMGCHSTPLYSHLHVPSVLVDAWTLDCSPSCRASPHVDCESDLFSSDPVRFVNTVYNLEEMDADTCETKDEQGYCSFRVKPIPDLLVVYSKEAFVLRDHLRAMGLKPIERFSHGINGLRLGSFQFGSDFGKDSFRHVGVADWIELSLDDMVLYAKPELLIDQASSSQQTSSS